MKYKIDYYQDDLYEVLDLEDNSRSVFRGSLSDCVAYIKANENGYML